MFYIVETDYIGPNPFDRQNLDTHTYDIRTRPVRAISSGEVRIEGCCGSSGEWSRYAHGEYATLAEAEAVIKAKLDGDCREDEEVGEDYTDECVGVVARYRVGRYAPMGREYSIDWAYAAVEEVDAGTSDAEIEASISECEKICREECNADLDAGALREAMQERRDERRDQRETAE